MDEGAAAWQPSDEKQQKLRHSMGALATLKLALNLLKDPHMIFDNACDLIDCVSDSCNGATLLHQASAMWRCDALDTNRHTEGHMKGDVGDY